MQTLHIVTPAHTTTPSTCIGLIRLVLQHIGGSHHVIVIGNESDVSDLRAMGLPVLGFVDGPLDTSRTLARRLQELIQQVTNDGVTQRIIAWGWHPASVASAISWDTSVIAIVDEIDASCSITAGELRIIPTSWTGSECLRARGIPDDSMTEPLIGVNPVTMVVDRSAVQEQLQLFHSDVTVGIVGRLGSWQEIIAMAVRLRAANAQADFIIFPRYEYRVQLMFAAKQQGLSDILHEIPSTMRPIDVVKVVDGIWVPSVMAYDVSCSVLDVVSIAWEGVPLAVPTNHPIAGVPTVGKHIAWARDEIEVCRWLLDLARDTRTSMNETTDITTRIRSIASPSRFIEGLQMRM